ncbi:MAG TPA: adenine deaminase [Chitinophagaceae bacterium]|nr:adenine deaminase [Chitinophagaceae bacterium]HNF71676.1 adenine deaminase [Chitinophagaceae bacterium]
MTLYHYLVDIEAKRIYPAAIRIQEGIICSVEETTHPCTHFALPGFIDAHVHIESSMLIPSEFARIAVRHGTVATVSDPHEIANVCGVQGVEYMLENASKVPFKFHFGAPSCVPATGFETAGAVIGPQEVKQLLERNDIYYLSEMMNYPGVINRDPEVMAKIEAAHGLNKPVDGHAPGLMGNEAASYCSAGISTDHECFTRDEALNKLHLGMKILIREGSAAKNFNALIDLLSEFEDQMMFCCDDKHPDELVLHHIDSHVRRAVEKGIDLFAVLKAACVNPVKHYQLPVGLLRVGDPADFIVVEDLKQFGVIKTFIQGTLVSENGKSLISSIPEKHINQFHCTEKQASDFRVEANPVPDRIRVIEAIDHQLITHTLLCTPKIQDGALIADVENDVLKLAVVNRYHDAPIAKAFIKNIGLKKGAIASTVAHDSHNIICTGTSNEAMARVVNALIQSRGGIAVDSGDELFVLPLPVAGLMSTEPAEAIAAAYSKASSMARESGSTLEAPFMTLSFMALLVIPQLKLSDRGLFDGSTFSFTDLNYDV